MTASRLFPTRALVAGALVLLAAPVLLPAPAMAQSSSSSSSMAKSVSYDTLQPHVGWYGTLGGSGIQPRDTDGTVNGTDSTLEYNMGYGLFGAGGYRFRNGLRLEGEIGYGSVGLDSFRYGGTGGNADGDLQLWSATGAAYYDLPTAGRVSPYIGGGAGAVRESIDRVSASSGGTTVSAEGDTDTNLTAFGEVGLNIALAPAFDLVPSYRYQWIDDGRDGFDDTQMHVFRAGLRYWF
ncbi:outer membrane protein [Ferrovibrio xuzhouensis]|uniref:Outer membrane protein n=1 Tax=Ferrovibrio xuzhouensis TaxID=1576914 RepID=A0ABV7VF98_9PROT